MRVRPVESDLQNHNPPGAAARLAERSGRSRLHPRRSDRLYMVLRALASSLARVAERLEPCETIVDYGCGDMPYRPLFEPRARSYVGLDIRANGASDGFLREDGGLPLPDGETDVILSTQVLEHVQDPAFYLREAHRALKPGGKLVLSTHGIWWYHPHPQDLWRWTGEGLTQLVREAGFELEELEGILGGSSAGIQLWQDYFQNRVPKRLRRVFYFCTQQLIGLEEKWISERERTRDAAVYVVVARKPRA